MNWLLIAVIAILGYCTYRGYKKGIIEMAVSLVIWILSIALTAILAPTIGQSLCESEIVVSYVSQGVNEQLGIENSLNEMTQEATENLKANKLNAKEQEQALTNIGLPTDLTNILLDGVSDTVNENGKIAAHKFAIYICDGIACIIIKALSYIIVFLIVKLLLKIASITLKVIDKIPGVEDASKIAGALVGITTGLLVVWILFLGIIVCSGTEFGIRCYQDVQDSMLLTFIYNNNLLLKWLLSGTVI